MSVAFHSAINTSNVDCHRFFNFYMMYRILWFVKEKTAVYVFVTDQTQCERCLSRFFCFFFFVVNNLNICSDFISKLCRHVLCISAFRYDFLYLMILHGILSNMFICWLIHLLSKKVVYWCLSTKFLLFEGIVHISCQKLKTK